MKIIAHRGNMSGPKPDLENCPAHIEKIINYFDAEIDVRVVNSKIWLGHDVGQYDVSLDWILKYRRRLWIHCKNLEAMKYFNSIRNRGIIYFGHSEDLYVLASNSYIITIKNDVFDKKSIIVMPEYFNTIYNIRLVGGVITDYPLDIRSQLVSETDSLKFGIP